MSDADRMLDLFIHPGWKQFQNDMEEALEALINGCHTASSSEEFFRQKGMIQSLSNVVNYQLLFRTNLDEQELPENEDDVV